MEEQQQQVVQTDNPRSGALPDNLALLDHSHLYRPAKHYTCPRAPRVLGVIRNVVLVGGYSLQQAAFYGNTLTTGSTQVGWITEGEELSNALFWVITAWSYIFLFPSTLIGYWPLVEKLLGKEITCKRSSQYVGLDSKAQKAKFALGAYTAVVKTAVATYRTYDLMSDLTGRSVNLVPLDATVTAVTGVSSLGCNTALLFAKQFKRISTENPYLEFYIRDIFVDSPELAHDLIALLNPTLEGDLSRREKWFARYMTSTYSFQNSALYTKGMLAVFHSFGWLTAEEQFNQWLFYVTVVAVLGPLTVGDYLGSHPFVVDYTYRLFNSESELTRKEKVQHFFKQLVDYDNGRLNMVRSIWGLAGAFQKFVATGASFASFFLGMSNSLPMKIVVGITDPLLSIGSGYVAVAVSNQPKKRIRLPFIEALSARSLIRLDTIAGAQLQTSSLSSVDEESTKGNDDFGIVLE